MRATRIVTVRRGFSRRVSLSSASVGDEQRGLDDAFAGARGGREVGQLQAARGEGGGRVGDRQFAPSPDIAAAPKLGGDDGNAPRQRRRQFCAGAARHEEDRVQERIPRRRLPAQCRRRRARRGCRRRRTAPRAIARSSPARRRRGRAPRRRAPPGRRRAPPGSARGRACRRSRSGRASVASRAARRRRRAAARTPAWRRASVRGRRRTASARRPRRAPPRACASIISASPSAKRGLSADARSAAGDRAAEDCAGDRCSPVRARARRSCDEARPP